MKKTVLILSLLLTIQLPVFCQGFYFKGQIGYDIPFLKSQQFYVSDNIVETYDSITYTSSYQAYKNAYATGLSLNAGVGYMITKYLGVELDGFYTSSRDQKFAAEIHYTDHLDCQYDSYLDYTFQGKFYGLKAGLNFSLPGHDLRPYTRIGVVVSRTELKEMLEMDNINNNPNYEPRSGMEYTLQYEKKFTAGANVAVGLEFMFLKRVWVYAEAEAKIVSYYPGSATYTSYVVNRRDITEQLSVHDKEIVYVKNYSDTDNTSADEPT
jgi:hypothetical protein